MAAQTFEGQCLRGADGRERPRQLPRSCPWVHARPSQPPTAAGSNMHKRAVLGNSDGAPPWGHPEPMGRLPGWARI
eukprot:5612293-Alexandrium_andersonii.AAC.1